MTRKLLAVFTALMLFGASSAWAQTSRNVTASITIPTILYIGITNANGASIAFPSPTATDFTAGSIAASNGTTLQHAGNVGYTVSVKAAASTMTATAGGTKAASDLQWSTDGGATWTGMSTTAATVYTTGSPGINTSNVTYQMLLNYATDTPDTYSLNFTYTIVTP